MEPGWQGSCVSSYVSSEKITVNERFFEKSEKIREDFYCFYSRQWLSLSPITHPVECDKAKFHPFVYHYVLCSYCEARLLVLQNQKFERPKIGLRLYYVISFYIIKIQR